MLRCRLTAVKASSSAMSEPTGGSRCWFSTFSGFLESVSAHTRATYLLLPAVIYATIDWKEVFTKDDAYAGDGCIESQE